jgi:hypothetical protein
MGAGKLFIFEADCSTLRLWNQSCLSLRHFSGIAGDPACFLMRKLGRRRQQVETKLETGLYRFGCIFLLVRVARRRAVIGPERDIRQYYNNRIEHPDIALNCLKT